MELIRSSDTNSNTYFFLSNFNDTFKAGKNSFIVNATQLIVPDTPITVTVYDSKNNILPSGVIKPTDARFSEQTNTGEFYYVSVLAEVDSGIGKIEISGTGIDVGAYTGSIAYFNNQAYPISRTQRLPLVSAPSSEPLPKVKISWSRNVLIDTTKKADCEVRFFDTPYIEVTPEIHEAPLFPSASFRMASGSFSSVAVLPKNNANGDYDRQFDVPIYQMFWNGGSKFSSSMEGEYIRIKGPSVKNFIYTNQTNNQVTFEGRLDTDFIAQIRRVVNDTTILLDIPFSTVSELIERSNLDSPYAKNNLVNIKGYNLSDNPAKQSVFHKRNFYVLSIDSGEFEIFYKSIQQQLPRAPANNSIKYKKSVLNIGYNNLKTLCGSISSYKIYGRSLNSPESKTLLREGRIDPYNLICSTKFDNGLYNDPGEFYTPNHLSRYWLSSSLNIGFSQSHEVLINGATISHNGNDSQTDYVIFKDDTSAGRTPSYVSYNLLSNSYWYAKSDAFLNSKVYPTSSYIGISNISNLSTYSNSQENLISGSIHDSNPIKLRANSVYEFSMYVKISPDNNDNSKLYAYFLSGNDKIKIAEIDNSIGSNINEKYTHTFYSDIERYGTIILVPVSGRWSISKLSLVPYHYVDYSVDSFDVKVPLPVSVNNELYEIETELYDEAGRLAYGKDSYTFIYNKTFLPLKKQIFVDPDGLTVPGIIGSGGGGSGLIYFGPNIVMDVNTGKITATQFNSSNVPIGSPPPAGTITFGSYIGLNLTTGAVTAYDFDTN